MSRLKSNRRGWDKLKKRLAVFDERSADVGFFKKSKYSDGERLYVAEVAWMNDQGTSQVPARPFFTVDFHNYASAHFKEDAKQLFFNILTKTNYPFMKEINRICEKYVDILKEFIYDYPGHNSPWWVEQKGFDDPLFHTGTMVESVDYRIRSKRNK